MSLMAKLTQTWQNDADSIRDSIVENICGLVSSRAPIWLSEAQSEILDGTIANLGIRSSASAAKSMRTEALVFEVKEMIRLFEPRLSQVSLEIIERANASNRLQFRISAIMHSALGEESIIFDSFLDLNSNQLDVRKTNFV